MNWSPFWVDLLPIVTVEITVREGEVIHLNYARDDADKNLEPETMEGSVLSDAGPMGAEDVWAAFAAQGGHSDPVVRAYATYAKQRVNMGLRWRTT